MRPSLMMFTSRDATEEFYEDNDDDILELYKTLTGDPNPPTCHPPEILTHLLDRVFHPLVRVFLTIIDKPAFGEKIVIQPDAKEIGPYLTNRFGLVGAIVATPGPVIRAANLVVEEFGTWLSTSVSEVYRTPVVYEIWTSELEYLGRVDINGQTTNYSATVWPFEVVGRLDLRFVLMRTT